MIMTSTNSKPPTTAYYESDDDDDHEVPPPPPHIELLNLGCEGHDQQCITRVISYLDGKSRRAACLSCMYLRDAVVQCTSLELDRERTIRLQEPIALVAVESPSRVTDIDDMPVFECNEIKKDRDEDESSCQPSLASEPDVDPTEEALGGDEGVSKNKSKMKGDDWSWLLDSEVKEPEVEEQLADVVDPAEPPVNEGLANKLKKLGGEPRVEKPAHHEEMSELTSSTFATESPAVVADGTDSEETPVLIGEASKSIQEQDLAQVVEQAQVHVAAPALVKNVSSEDAAVKKRNILDEMDDLEEELSKHSSMASTLAELQADPAAIEPTVSYAVLDTDDASPTEHTPRVEEDGNEDNEAQDDVDMSLGTPLINDVKEAELESVCTTDRKIQTDMFLRRVSSSGERTPLSFLSSESYTNEPREETRNKLANDRKNTFVDEFSVLPTVSSISSGNIMNIHSHSGRSPITPSPVTPVIDTPSPATLTGATRLVMGSTSHLGSGSRQLHITGQVEQQSNRGDVVEDDMAGSNTSSVDSSSEMQQISLGSRKEADEKFQQPPQMPHSFTRLNDIRNVAKEEIPFDEMIKPVARRAPVVSESISFSSSNRGGGVGSLGDSPQLTPQSHRTFDDVSDITFGQSVVPNMNLNYLTEDDTTDYKDSSDERTTPDVLAQLSDAALFGDTPQMVTEIMSEIVDSAKGAVSLLYLNGRRNDIDDHGPIKIGDKYYSHNEALQLWRKAKVKLEDRYHQVDENGDVKMERAKFFERNSVFQEKPKKKKKKDKVKEENNKLNGASNKDGKGEDMSLDKMVKKYRILGKRDDMRKKSRFDEFADESVGFGESTAVAGHIVSNDEDSSELLPLEQSELSPKSSLFPSRVSKTSKEEKGPTEVKHVSFSFEVDNDTGDTDDTESETIGSHTSEVVSDSTDSGSGDHGENSSETSDSNRSPASLNESIMLTRERAFVAGNDQVNAKMEVLPKNTTLPFTNKKTLNIETDSVAGKDSLPSHMGSNYGLEVTSIRGMSCNFISGKSSEQVKLGGKSVRGEQSVLGSQYGTEVLFKPQGKVVTARKPRTLACHNMGVKKVAAGTKQGTVLKQGMGSSNGRGTPTITGSIRKEKQTTSAINKGLPASSARQQQRRMPSPSPLNRSSKISQPVAMKVQKTKSLKPNLPLKLKLGKKKTTKA